MAKSSPPIVARAAALLLLLGLLWSLPASSTAQTVTERLDVEQPRGFGYMLGDKFSRVIHLDLRQPYRLDLDELPRPGRLGDWLRLEQPRVTSERSDGLNRYRIELTYQVINVNADFSDIAVPDHTLSYGNGDETLQALIPATRVLLSPLRTGNGHMLQPAHAPRPYPHDRTLALIAVAVLAASGLGFAYLHWGWPSSSRTRPFRTAARHAARLGHGTDESQRRAVLEAVHGAFNATAGRTVFTETLDDFFAAHDRYVAAREPIERYFAYTRAYFYGETEPASEAYDPTEIKRLLRRLSEIERGLR